MIFEHDYIVQIRDTSKKSEASNVALLGFLEDIAGAHSDKVGYGYYDIPKKHLTWLLLDWKLQVIKRPHYADKIHVKTWSRYIERCYAYRDFEIYDKDGKLLAIATSKWVLIDSLKGRVIKVEDEVANAYESETEKSVFNLKTLDKIKEPETFESKFEYTVARRDIDLYNHMHNLYYLQIAYEALPEKVYESESLDNVRIHYKKETKLGDKLTCYYSFENGKHIVTMKVHDVLHCIIELW